jgi:NlpC/P60 family putative phage cell wall peptidase
MQANLSEKELHSRDDVVATARAWLGTFYHHQASRCGVGVDCLGLIRGVYRSLYDREAEALPAYSRDWAEAEGRETMIEAARRHLVERSLADVQAGDVVLFRIFEHGVAKHAGLMTDSSHFIHAMEGRPVSEVAMTRWWRRRLAGAFSFPSVDR